MCSGKFKISRASVLRANSKIMAADRTGVGARQTDQHAVIDEAATTPSNRTYDPEEVRRAGELAMSKFLNTWPEK